MEETLDEKLKRIHDAINRDLYAEHLEEKKELWKKYQELC